VSSLPEYDPWEISNEVEIQNENNLQDTSPWLGNYHFQLALTRSATRLEHKFKANHFLHSTQQ